MQLRPTVLMAQPRRSQHGRGPALLRLGRWRSRAALLPLIGGLLCSFSTGASAQDRWWEAGYVPGTRPAPETPEAERNVAEPRANPPERIEPPAPATPVPQIDSSTSPDDSVPGGVEGEDTAALSHTVPSAIPVWRWQQVMSSPRVGGRLTAVAVDPQRPNRIFVGTEEGTMLRSLDGGTTWREIEMWPFVTPLRSTRPKTPGLPSLGTPTRLGLDIFMDPPYRASPPDRISLAVSNLWFSLRPEFVWIGFTPATSTVSNQLLAAAVRNQPTNSVKRIVVCPGAAYPLVVATSQELLGSTDEGLTYVRLMRIPNVKIRQVVCSRLNPNRIMVATDFGMYASADGGISFDQDLSGWPGQKTTSLSYGAGPGGIGEQAYVATGTVLYVGDPQSDEGLVFNYPDFNNSETAPWGDIAWVEPEGRNVWLGTSDGVRMSRDGGSNWEVVARTLLSRHRVWQVTAGANENGGTRVAVLVRDCPLNEMWCRSSKVYATDDAGLTWHPFFDSATRRNIYQMAAAPGIPGVPPRWWVVSAGELWATVPGELQDMPDVDWDSAEWAREKIRTTPRVGVVVQDALTGTDLSRERINWFLDGIKARHYVPIINFNVGYIWSDFDRQENVQLTFPRDNFERHGHTGLFGWVNFTWHLPFTAIATEELGPVRFDIYSLRRHISFFTEDAWHERMLHLRRIATGMSDRLQIEILKTRIEALETVMETWARRPIRRGARPPGR